MQQLQPLVANAKLDHPLDSHPPLSRKLMLIRLKTDDWGNTTDGVQEECQEHEHPPPAEDEHYPTEHKSEQHYQDRDSNEQWQEEDSSGHDYNQEDGTRIESEDDYQEE
jgi:hypothetical protein